MIEDVILDDEGFISIDTIDFFGKFEKSKNGVFIIAWVDYSNANRSGKFILLERKQIILEGFLERPNDGKVADNGTFILHDWLFGSQLQGIFYAFDKFGRQIIQETFSANIHNNGLSNDGQYAVCQLAASNSTDGGILAFFDLNEGQMLWKIKPATGWADSYQFDNINRVLYLVYKKIGKFRYDYDGNFLDQEKWYKAKIRYGTGFDILKIVEEKQKRLREKSTDQASDEIISLLQIAITRLSEYPYQVARVYRLIGEIYENLDQTKNAVENYEKAISYYPKIGVKRKLAELRNQTI